MVGTKVLLPAGRHFWGRFEPTIIGGRMTCLFSQRRPRFEQNKSPLRLRKEKQNAASAAGKPAFEVETTISE